MAWTNAFSDASCTKPALPGLGNFRVICNTLGMDGFACDFSCAAVMQLHVRTRDNPNRNRLSLFMDANLLICEMGLIWMGSKKLPNEQRRNLGGDYPRPGMMSSATDRSVTGRESLVFPKQLATGIRSLSSIAGGCGSLWLKRLPLSDLFGHLILLALVCGIFPPTPKLFEPGVHKSGSSRFAFWFVAVAVSHVYCSPFNLRI